MSGFLGYAPFTGGGTRFTIPVIQVDDFTLPTADDLSNVVNMSLNTFNSLTWNSNIEIFNSMNTVNVEGHPESPVGGGAKSQSNPTVDFESTTHVYADGQFGILSVWINNTEEFWFKIDQDTVVEYPCIFYLPAMSNKYYIAHALFHSSAGQYKFYLFKDSTPFVSLAYTSTPIKARENPVTSLKIDPSEQYFYENLKVDEISISRDWCNISIIRENGAINEVNIDDIEWSVSSSQITNLTISLNPNYDGVYYTNRFVIEYERESTVSENWSVTVTYKPDPSISATINYQKIGIVDVYTPGVGGGTNSGFAGGGGNFGVINGVPETSDNVVNSLPGIGTPSGSYEGSVSNSGLFVHYAMNATMLEVVGDWLWANDLGLIIAKEVLSILYGSPIESAISLMSYPFNVTALPGVVTRQQNIYWGSHEIGGLSGGISGTAITNPYATIDWGKIQLTEFWGNFLDYAPHTKLELYLPWCTGFVPIDPNECLPGSLRVVTNIELAKGTCLHNVIGNDGRVIATHTGTCGKQLPLTALDTSGKALALVGGAAMAAVVGGAALMGGTAGAMYGGFDVAKLQGPNGQRWVPYDKPGNISTALEGAKSGAGIAAKASKKPAVMAAAAGLRANVTVPRNGTFTGSTAGLGVQYPYLIISRPTQSVPKQYGHHYGYPSNIYAPLHTLRGYTEIGEIHLTGFTCTEDELAEIDSLLKSGVIL